jgi:hypothetical protein
MSSLSSARPTEVAQITIQHNDHAVGFLIAEDEAGEESGNRRLYRFAALDRHFTLLDGSRFTTAHRAHVAVARLGRFVDRPPAANEA